VAPASNVAPENDSVAGALVVSLAGGASRRTSMEWAEGDNAEADLGAGTSGVTRARDGGEAGRAALLLGDDPSPRASKRAARGARETSSPNMAK
jgi:hypothetical protein